MLRRRPSAGRPAPVASAQRKMPAAERREAEAVEQRRCRPRPASRRSSPRGSASDSSSIGSIVRSTISSSVTSALVAGARRRAPWPRGRSACSAAPSSRASRRRSPCRSSGRAASASSSASIAVCPSWPMRSGKASAITLSAWTAVSMPDHVEQQRRPHRPAPLLHHLVDALVVDAVLQQPHEAGEVREQHAVDEEARAVVDHDRRLAHRLRVGDGRGDRLLGRAARRGSPRPAASAAPG